MIDTYDVPGFLLNKNGTGSFVKLDDYEKELAEKDKIIELMASELTFFGKCPVDFLEEPFSDCPNCNGEEQKPTKCTIKYFTEKSREK